MGYLMILKKYKMNITAMAAFVAWLWFFPLFGIMQTALRGSEGKMTFFNLTFLGFMVLGYHIFLYLRDMPILQTLIAAAAPVTVIATWLVALLAWQFPADIVSPWGYDSIAMFVLLPVFMGFSGAIYFAFWGTTIFYTSPDERGRYMAAMVAAATIFYMALVIVFYAAPLLALFLSGMILFIPSFSIKTVTSSIKNSQKEGISPPVFSTKIEVNYKLLNPRKDFWLPFSLTILSFYILAWATHEIIFSVIKEESTFSPIFGSGIYALTIIFAAFFLDKEKEIEKMALLGLIVLGCSFLLLPVAFSVGVLWPVYYLLEASYGFIDLFMWVSLAYFCQLLAGDPRQYYARGLILNILFIILGIIMMPLLNVNFEGGGYFILSLAAGIILFIGVLPALSLRKFRLVRLEEINLPDIIEREIEKFNNKQGIQIEDFTQKEKEILYLILNGFKNAEIIEEQGISKNTLKTHVRNIYRKAEVKNRSELLFKFMNHTNTTRS